MTRTSRAERLTSNTPDMDAVVIINGQDPFLDTTYWYLTELFSGTFEGGIAVVRDGELNTIVSPLEAEGASAGKGTCHVYDDREHRNKILKDLLDGCNDVGFNMNGATYAGVEYVKKNAEINPVNATKGIEETIAVKDEKEIALMRKACEITSVIAEEIPDILKAGMTEKEAATEIDRRIREKGGDGNAFDTIAAFGPNSSMPHHTPTDRKLKDGDTTLFDFGSKYSMYCSDLTRTVFFGKPPEVLKRAYKVVKEAQEEGFLCYKDGASAAEADIRAREIIDAGEFKGKMIHTFGHGLGMNIHEGISVYSKSEQVLKEGNVVSAEPGIYLPGIGGIRIEDTCLIKKDGAERLTSFDRSMTIL